MLGTRQYFSAGFLSVLNILTGLITLPYAAITLSTLEFEFWLIFINLQIFINLFEFGMGPNIARYYTYIANGAMSIRANSLPKYHREKSYLLGDFKEYMLLMYALIFGFALFATMIISNAYLALVLNQRDAPYEFLAIWSVSASFLCLNLLFGFCNAILIGTDRIEQSNITLILNRLTFLAACIVALAVGTGIWSFAIAIALGVVVSRIYSVKLVYKDIGATVVSLRRVMRFSRKTMYFNKVVLPAVMKLSVTQFASFTLQRFTIFVSPMALGPSLSSQYILTLNIFQALTAFSLIPVNLNVTRVTLAHRDGTVDRLIPLIRKIYFTEIFMFCASATVIVFTYGRLIDFLGIEAADFRWVVGLAILTYCLEVIHVTAATIITTFNKVPFAPSAVISSISIILLTVLIFNTATAFSLLFIQFLVQVTYNNWYWPLYLRRKVRRIDG